VRFVKLVSAVHSALLAVPRRLYVSWDLELIVTVRLHLTIEKQLAANLNNGVAVLVRQNLIKAVLPPWLNLINAF